WPSTSPKPPPRTRCECSPRSGAGSSPIPPESARRCSRSCPTRRSWRSPTGPGCLPRRISRSPPKPICSRSSTRSGTRASRSTTANRNSGSGASPFPFRMRPRPRPCRSPVRTCGSRTSSAKTRYPFSRRWPGRSPRPFSTTNAARARGGKHRPGPVPLALRVVDDPLDVLLRLDLAGILGFDDGEDLLLRHDRDHLTVSGVQPAVLDVIAIAQVLDLLVGDHAAGTGGEHRWARGGPLREVVEQEVEQHRDDRCGGDPGAEDDLDGGGEPAVELGFHLGQDPERDPRG